MSVTVRMTPAAHARLEALRRKLGARSLAEVVRQAVEELAKREGVS